MKLSNSLTLPTENKKAIADLSRITMVLAGEKGIGKTSFAAQFPDHFILECEQGNANHLDCNYVDIHDWKEFESYIDLLEKNPTYCKTLIVDELQQAYYYLQLYLRKELNIEDSGQLGYTGWGAAQLKLNKLINRIQALSIGKIYTAHTQVNEVNLRDGRIVSKLETTLQKQPNETMDKYAKLWGIMLWDKDNKRTMYLEGDDKLKACQKYPNNFKGVKKIDLGSSPEIAYENFVRAFNNETISEKKRNFKIGN